MYVNLYEWCLLSCHQKQLNGFLKHAQLSLSAKLMCVRLQSLLKIPFSDQAHHIWSLDNWCMSKFGPLFQLSAGKVSHFQFNVNLWDYFFGLALKWSRLLKKHPPVLNLYLTKKILISYFSSKAQGWWIPAFLMQNIWPWHETSISEHGCTLQNPKSKGLMGKGRTRAMYNTVHIVEKQELEWKIDRHTLLASTTAVHGSVWWPMGWRVRYITAAVAVDRTVMDYFDTGYMAAHIPFEDLPQTWTRPYCHHALLTHSATATVKYIWLN